MNCIERVAAKSQKEAWKVIEDSDVVNIWKSVNADVNLVGSLKTGLLVKHRDIDFHIYTASVNVADDFSVMAKLAANPRIRRIDFTNLMDTEEKCLEWHAWYEAENGEVWQIDMIHIRKGSVYDGYFERVAERIAEVLTEETREAIMRLKYETPEEEKIMGIEYYQAVIQDGVRTYGEFMRWREKNPVCGVIEWMP